MPLKKPERKRQKPKGERYRSDRQEESAIATSERSEGMHPRESTYNQRLRDGFRMLHYDEWQQ